jgi:hypothetical protein
MDVVEIEVWVMVDEDGDFEVSKDADELQAPAGKASRLLKMTLTVPQPKTVELAAVVSEEAPVGELKMVG